MTQARKDQLSMLAAKVRELHEDTTNYKILAEDRETKLKAAKLLLIEAASEVAEVIDGKKQTVEIDGVQIMFPKDSLISKVDADLLAKIRKYSGRLFAKLFVPEFKPAPDFRLLAFRYLPATRAQRLIDACETPSKPRVKIG